MAETSAYEENCNLLQLQGGVGSPKIPSLQEAELFAKTFKKVQEHSDSRRQGSPILTTDLGLVGVQNLNI
jgi:hypothetical protein